MFTEHYDQTVKRGMTDRDNQTITWVACDEYALGPKLGTHASLSKVDEKDTTGRRVKDCTIGASKDEKGRRLSRG